MPGQIRVYELARELGLTNKETLDLCDALGVGVKSHSSSIVEAQADRVRRKAEREGLIREHQPEEPKKTRKPTKKEAAAAAAAAAEAPPAEEPAPAAPAVAEPAPAADAPAPVATPEPVVEAPAEAPAPAAEREAPEEPATAPAEKPEKVAAESAATRPAAPLRQPIRSSGMSRLPSVGEARPAAAPAPPPPPRAPERQERPVAPAASAGPSAGAPPRPATPPRSVSGKPIPPPPGPPTSLTGKPIPPPPGLGGRGPSPQRGGVGRPSGGPPRTGGARPVGGGMPGRGPGGGGGPGGGPGGPPGGGPGGGGPGGRGRGGPPRQARRPTKSRGRRRNRDELQPLDVPTYTPREAPVPEGTIVVERGSTPQDLGAKLNRTAADVVRFLLQQGEMVTATQSLNDDMIELFAAEIGAEIRLVDPGEEQEVELQKLLEVGELEEGEADHDSLPSRPPVITVMGHVDHGKTKLLDRIRRTNVVAGEAGGITQHIGAYQVVKNDRPITFIDTPGHEAFTAMRARGAQATDVVILVVAADDGVMPQTVEALEHARAAEVPIVVAVNKIDREQADPNRVMQQLSERGLVPEAWGGDTPFVEVSALQDIGIDELLETILVVAELEDLRATPDGRAGGVVLEAHLDVGRGPIATVLVERGTLRVGDPLVAGAAWGRVRALVNDHGEQVKEAGPSTPVQVLGLSDVAGAGDRFVVAPDEKKARSVAETREHWQRVAALSRDAHALSGGARLEDIFDQIQSGESATLNLVVKADVTGSLEALTESLKKLERDTVKLSFVLRGVGGISENDVQLASASNATIIGFNVRPTRQAREMAEREDVEIRTYEIIYQVIEDIENAMVGMLAPEFEEVVTGDAEVREIFRVPRVGSVAGCMVLNGTITRNSKVRFLRDGTIIWKGTVSSLKRFKEDAREVHAGFECGIGLSDFQDLKQGDIIETYEEREIPRG